MKGCEKVSAFNYQTPDDFKKEEEKWFKYFTIPSLFATLAAAIVTGAIFIPIFYSFGLIYIGIIVTLICSILMFAAVSFEIPVGSKLPGEGSVPVVILFRICMRKRKANKIIYVKNYGDYECFEEEERI